jgi:hypothetical protein
VLGETSVLQFSLHLPVEGRPRVLWAWPAGIHGLCWADTLFPKVAPYFFTKFECMTSCGGCSLRSMKIWQKSDLVPPWQDNFNPFGGHRFVDSGIHCAIHEHAIKVPAYIPIWAKIKIPKRQRRTRTVPEISSSFQSHPWPIHQLFTGRPFQEIKKHD